MSDVEYRIVTNLDTSGDFESKLPSAGKLSGIDSAFSKIGSSLKSTVGTVSDLFESAVEKVAGLTIKAATFGAAMSAAAVGFGVKFNSEIEQVRLGLASTLTAFGHTRNINEGLVLSQQITSKMLQDVKVLPATFAQFSTAVRNLSSAVFQGGGSSSTLEEFAKKTVMFGAIAGLSPEQASSSMAMMLTGRITGANPIARQLGITGAEAAHMRQLDPEHRLEEITKLLDKFKDANELFAHSFKAIATTTKDNAMLFMGAATAPLFGKIKSTLEDANNWFSKHRSEVNKFTDHIGRKLVTIFDYGKAKLIEWYPILRDFAISMEQHMVSAWQKIKPVVFQIADKIKDLLKDSDGTFDKIKTILELYAASKIGGKLAPSVLPLAGTLGKVGMSALGEGGLAGAGVAGGAVAGGLLAAAIGTAGAIDILTNKTNTLHNSAVKDYNNINKEIGSISHTFNTELFPTLRTFADLFGKEMLASLSGSLTILEKGAKVATAPQNWLQSTLASVFGGKQGMHVETSLADGINRGVGIVLAREEGKGKGLSNITGGGGTNIAKVVIEVYQSGDPSRVSRAVMDRLVDLQRYPKSSPFVPNYSSSRTR